MSPSGFKCALSWSSTTPGSTFTVMRSRSTIPIRFRYLEKSITIAGPTVWPDKLVAAPRGRIGKRSWAAILTTAGHVACRPGDDHAQGLDLIEAGVGRVQPAHSAVEIELGARLLAQAVGQAIQGETRRSPWSWALVAGSSREAERAELERGRPAYHSGSSSNNTLEVSRPIVSCLTHVPRR